MPMPALGAPPRERCFPLTLLIAIMGRERQVVAQLHRPRRTGGVLADGGSAACRSERLSTMLHHVQGYLKRAGDAVATGTPDPLVFPRPYPVDHRDPRSLTLTRNLVYFHPGNPFYPRLLGFLFVLCARSGPSSLCRWPCWPCSAPRWRTDGQFGAPIVAIGLTLPVDWLACALGTSGR